MSDLGDSKCAWSSVFACLGHNSYVSLITTLSKFFKITKNCLYLIKLKRNDNLTYVLWVLWPFIRVLSILTEILSPRDSRARVRNKRGVKSIQILDDICYVKFCWVMTLGRCPSQVLGLSLSPSIHINFLIYIHLKIHYRSDKPICLIKFPNE